MKSSITKAYRIEETSELLSFGDLISTVPLLGKPLSLWQEEVCASCGITIVDVSSRDEIAEENVLVFPNHLFFSKEFLKSILIVAQSAESSLEFVLDQNSFNHRYFLPVSTSDELPYRFGFSFVHHRGAALEKHKINQEIFKNSIRFPKSLYGEAEFSVDHCTVFALPIVTPFHLLQANLAALLYPTAKVKARLPEWYMRLFLKPYSPQFYWGLKLFNKRGKNCRIHPTAVLEGVTLGDNVIIGAHCVVRLSHIGSNTTLEDQSSVLYSVLGEDNYIANKNHVEFCMSYDHVFLIHGPYQFSIYGRESAAFATINCDTRMDQKTITIPSKDGFVDSRQHFLGIALGHGAKSAGGNVILPGRIVPNNYTMPVPENVIHRIPRG